MKNLLVVSHNVIGNTNNGRAIVSFIEANEIENVAQLYFYNEPPSYNINNTYNLNYFRITDMDLIKRLFKFKNYAPIGSNYKNSYLKENLITNSLRSKKLNHFRKLVKGVITILIRDMVWSLIDIGKTNIIEWSTKNNPDSILFLLSDATFSIDIVIALSKQLKIRPIILVTDDYINPYSQDNFLIRFHKKRLISRLNQLNNIDSYFLFLSDTLRVIYSSSYKIRNHSLFFMKMSIDNKINRKLNNTIDKDKIKLVYSGNLSLGRDRMIVEIAELIEKSTTYRLSISSIEYPSMYFIRKIKGLNNTHFHGKLSRDDNDLLLNESDIAIHVESFSKRYIKVTRYSISTKIFDYINASIPIIAYGPEYLESMNYIIKNKIGFVCSDINDLLIKLNSVVSNREVHESILRQQAFLNAVDNYDS